MNRKSKKKSILPKMPSQRYVETPLYTEIPGFRAIIVGLNHHQKPDDRAKRRQFLKLLGNTDHLLIEGDNDLYASAPGDSSISYESYERLAATAFRGGIHYLEGQDVLAACGKYGLRRHVCEVFLFIRTLGRLWSIYGIEYVNAHAAQLGRALLENLKSKDSFRSLDINRTIINMNRIYALAEFKDPMVSVRIGGAFEQFEPRVRDYEIMGPRAQELCSRLPGKKTILVGFGHVEYLSKLLMGGIVIPPTQWQDFLEGVERREKAGIEQIENVVLP